METIPNLPAINVPALSSAALLWIAFGGSDFSAPASLMQFATAAPTELDTDNTVPQTPNFGGGYYEVVTDGSGLNQVIDLSGPPVPPTGNARIMNAPLIFVLKTLTNPADVVQITVNGGGDIITTRFLGGDDAPNQFTEDFGVRLNAVGHIAVFRYWQGQWAYDQAASNNATVFSPAGAPVAINPPTAANGSGFAGGDIDVAGSNADPASNQHGGHAGLSAGAGAGTGFGGQVYVVGGTATGTGRGGQAGMSAGASQNGDAGFAYVLGGTPLSIGGKGGDAILRGGDTANGGTVQAGDTYIAGGLAAGGGGGRNGLVILGQNSPDLGGAAPLPTADPGVSGALWVDPATHILHVSP